MYYTQEGIDEMGAALAALPSKYTALIFAFYDRQYQTARGREFASQGFSRRIGTLRRCIERVFALLPPDLDDIPGDEEREDATIALQAFIFNVFGCLDNLAWIWVEERAVRKANGDPLTPNMIGFGSKYERVRDSFSPTFQAYLDTLAPWFAHIEGYRHALAHRIPLYIPPHFVSPANQGAYLALEQQITTAAIAGDQLSVAELKAQQRALMFFRPVTTHSFGENAPIMAIHPQMLADFHTIEEIAQHVLAELGLP
jgi:hypothetical protein